MKKLFYACFVLFLYFLVGCSPSVSMMGMAVNAAVQGYIIWNKTESTKYYFSDKDILYRAVKKSARDLKLSITKDEQNGGKYNLTLGEKDTFKIKIEQVEQTIVKVSIRINTLGDKSYAELFYNTIDDNLNIIEFNNGVPLYYKVDDDGASSEKKETPQTEKRRKLLKRRANR